MCTASALCPPARDHLPCSGEKRSGPAAPCLRSVRANGSPAVPLYHARPEEGGGPHQPTQRVAERPEWPLRAHVSGSINHRHASIMHGRGVIMHRRASTMYCHVSTMHRHAVIMHCHAVIIHRRASTMHRHAVIMHRRTSTMHCHASTMHRRAVIIHRRASTMHRRASTMHCRANIMHGHTGIMHGRAGIMHGRTVLDYMVMPPPHPRRGPGPFNRATSRTAPPCAALHASCAHRAWRRCA